MEKSLDNEDTTRENLEENLGHSSTSGDVAVDKEIDSVDEEEEEEVEEEEEGVFLDARSAVNEQNLSDIVVGDGERCLGLVMSTDEAAPEDKINHKDGLLVTEPKLKDSLLTTCEKEDTQADGGMRQDGVTELELELKPEE